MVALGERESKFSERKQERKKERTREGKNKRLVSRWQNTTGKFKMKLTL